jgi:hypothetical protein
MCLGSLIIQVRGDAPGLAALLYFTHGHRITMPQGSELEYVQDGMTMSTTFVLYGIQSSWSSLRSAILVNILLSTYTVLNKRSR